MELWQVDYTIPPIKQICIECNRELDIEVFYAKNKGKCSQCISPQLNWPNGTKECGLCNREKYFVEYHRDNYLGDGFRKQCKCCVKRRNQRSQEHKEILSKRTRDWVNINGHSLSNPNRLPKASDIPKSGKPSTEKRKNLRHDSNTDLLPDFMNHLQKYYGNHCLACNKKYNPDIKMDNISHDHVIPVTKGGLHTYENSQPLCLKCNIQKGNRSSRDYRTIPILTADDIPNLLLCNYVSLNMSLYICQDMFIRTGATR